MHDGWMTTAALLARTRVPGKRPDAVLKRLRRECILARPVRGQSRGRARGVTWWYPPGSDQRINRVVELRGRGLRAFRDLRWQLWLEGVREVWDCLRSDLLAVYPQDVAAELERLAALDEDAVDDAIASEAAYLGGRWSGRPLPTGEPAHAVSRLDQETLAHVAIGAALPGHALALDSAVDEVSGGKTIGNLVDNSWGSRSASVHDELAATGAVHATGWEAALRRSSTAEAALAAELLRRTFDPKALRRNLRLFGDEWSGRALLVGANLSAIQASFGEQPGQ